MKVTRFGAALAAGVLAAGLVLTSCSSGGGGDPSAGGSGAEQIELRFAWWGSDTLNDIKAQQIALFEKAHPNITVAGEPSEYNGYYDKLATQVDTALAANSWTDRAGESLPLPSAAANSIPCRPEPNRRQT